MAYSTTKKERNGFVTVWLLPRRGARFFFITVNLNDYNTAVKPPGKCRILTKKCQIVPDTTGKVPDSARYYR